MVEKKLWPKKIVGKKAFDYKKDFVTNVSGQKKWFIERKFGQNTLFGWKKMFHGR